MKYQAEFDAIMAVVRARTLAFVEHQNRSYAAKRRWARERAARSAQLQRIAIRHFAARDEEYSGG